MGYLLVKSTDYSPWPDYRSELAPPCPDNVTEIPRKPDHQSKDLFGSLPSPDTQDIHSSGTNYYDEAVSLGLNHEIIS